MNIVVMDTKKSLFTCIYNIYLFFYFHFYVYFLSQLQLCTHIFLILLFTPSILISYYRFLHLFIYIHVLLLYYYILLFFTIFYFLIFLNLTSSTPLFFLFKSNFLIFTLPLFIYPN